MAEETVDRAGKVTTEEGRKEVRWRQTRLREYTPDADTCKHPNIPPCGDPMAPRRDGDGILRVSFQNARGTTLTGGLEIPYEIDALDELGINIGGYGETNKPWTPGNRWKYNHLMSTRFQGPERSTLWHHPCTNIPTNWGVQC